MTRLSVPGAVAERATPPSGELDDHLRAVDVAPRIGRWGFLAHPDLPDAPGPAFLLVALRPAPTLQHYDPEAIDYWISQAGRGERRTLTRETPMPRSEDFSWGLIRLVDRLRVTNEYLDVRRAPRRGGGRRDRRRGLRVAGSAAPTGRPLPGLGRRRGRGRRVLRSADGGRRLHPGFRGPAGGDIAAHALRGVRPRRGRTRADIVRSPDRRQPLAAAPLGIGPAADDLGIRLGGSGRPAGRSKDGVTSRP